MQKRVVFGNSRKQELVGIIHVPKRPRGKGVLFAHGFTSSKDSKLIKFLSEGLEEKGFHVFRFDFAGNGESQGKFEDMTFLGLRDDLDCAVEIFSGYVSEICVAGRSLGGAIACLACGNQKIDEMVLLSPLLSRSSNYFSWKQVLSQLFIGRVSFKDVSGSERALKRKFLVSRLFSSIFRKISACRKRSLTIIGTDDELVSVGRCISLSRKSAHNSIELIPGEDHSLRKHKKQVFDRMLEFLD